MAVGSNNAQHIATLAKIGSGLDQHRFTRHRFTVAKLPVLPGPDVIDCPIPHDAAPPSLDGEPSALRDVSLARRAVPHRIIWVSRRRRGWEVVQSGRGTSADQIRRSVRKQPGRRKSAVHDLPLVRACAPECQKVSSLALQVSEEWHRVRTIGHRFERLLLGPSRPLAKDQPSRLILCHDFLPCQALVNDLESNCHRNYLRMEVAKGADLGGEECRFGAGPVLVTLEQNAGPLADLDRLDQAFLYQAV